MVEVMKKHITTNQDNDRMDVGGEWEVGACSEGEEEGFRQVTRETVG